MILSVIFLSMLMMLIFTRDMFDLLILCQQLKLACELEFNLGNILDWATTWLVDFNAGKAQVVLFNSSNKSVAIDAKMVGLALDEKASFKILGLVFIL